MNRVHDRFDGVVAEVFEEVALPVVDVPGDIAQRLQQGLDRLIGNARNRVVDRRTERAQLPQYTLAVLDAPTPADDHRQGRPERCGGKNNGHAQIVRRVARHAEVDAQYFYRTYV